MSTKVEYGSGSSRHTSSRKCSSTKHSAKSSSKSSSKLSSKSSSSKSSSKSPTQSNSNTDSTESSNSSHTYVPSEQLIYYINDPTHSNPGYSAAYTTALTYTYGFPQDPAARVELEQEAVVESQARVQGNINGYQGQMSSNGQ